MRVFNFSHTAQEAIKKDIERAEHIDQGVERVVCRELLSRPSTCVQTDLMDRTFCTILHNCLKSHLEKNWRHLIMQKK